VPEAAGLAGTGPANAGGVGGAGVAGGEEAADLLARYAASAVQALRAGALRRGGPLPGGGPEGVRRSLEPLLAPEALLPEHGDPAAPERLLTAFAETAADPADPACAAHLHCPPLAVAAAADLAVSALNPSLDSWDQAPGGTEIEPAVIRTLAGLVGFDPDGRGEGPRASGVMTTGGTESNLMGLLLARDAALAERFGIPDPAAQGIPPAAAGRLRILCSAAAHFSFARSAAQLGLGSSAVVTVAVDAAGRMDPVALDAALAAAEARGEVVICVAATAGTTDLGAIDPLRRIAEITAAHGVRLHVDAAYGGGALFSRRLAPLLDGLDRADTVGLDLHKLGWQPVAAGVFLVRDARTLAPLEHRAAYLNPRDDEDAGYRSLLGRSLRTTRRPDALKVAVTMAALGRAGLGALVDRCHDLARFAAARIAADRRLELTADPVLTSVLFRYRTASGRPADDDAVNAELRRRLLDQGTAVVGRTEYGEGAGSVRLKLTLLNPQATPSTVDALLARVVAAGEAVEAEMRAAVHEGSGGTWWQTANGSSEGGQR